MATCRRDVRSCFFLLLFIMFALAIPAAASAAGGTGEAGGAGKAGGAGEVGVATEASGAGKVTVNRDLLRFTLPALPALPAPPARAALPAPPALSPSQAAPEDDPDLDVDPLQADFTLITMPTTLRMPRGKSAFRVTHRFTRALGDGDFGSLVEDFFGIDAGAAIGLEYRFGLMRGTHVGIRRTNDRTIEFMAEYNLLQERNSRPLGASVVASIDGTNNFRDSYTPGLGVILSRSLQRAGTVYLEPKWVNNSNPLPSELADDNDTFLIGVGARLRVRPSVYLVGEVLPRVAGFDPGVNHATFGVEKLLGLHVFQLNFSNSFGTTTGQVTRGGANNDDWYLGFSISRKFF